MKLISILALALALPGLAEAQTTQRGPMKELSPEQRESMAAAHQKMAECLRAGSDFHDCHQQMWETCKAMGDAGACPMMGKGMMGHKKMMKKGKMGQGMEGASRMEPGSGQSRQGEAKGQSRQGSGQSQQDEAKGQSKTMDDQSGQSQLPEEGQTEPGEDGY